MSAKGSWIRIFDGYPEIRVPRVDVAVTCHSPHPEVGFRCTRRRGHTGRHASCGINWQVLAVWS